MSLIQWFQRKRKAIPPTYLYFNQKFSDFVPRASSALENSPTLLSTRFSTAIRRPRKAVEISNQCTTRFLKNPFIGFPSHPFFVPPIQVSCLGCDYRI